MIETGFFILLLQPLLENEKKHKPFYFAYALIYNKMGLLTNSTHTNALHPYLI